MKIGTCKLYISLIFNHFFYEKSSLQFRIQIEMTKNNFVQSSELNEWMKNWTKKCDEVKTVGRCWCRCWCWCCWSMIWIAKAHGLKIQEGDNTIFVSPKIMGKREGSMMLWKSPRESHIFGFYCIFGNDILEKNFCGILFLTYHHTSPVCLYDVN